MYRALVTDARDVEMGIMNNVTPLKIVIVFEISWEEIQTMVSNSGVMMHRFFP
jgi:hypothetical protein